MSSWINIIFVVDHIIFGLYFVSVCYLLIFAIGSMVNRNKVYKKAKRELRYVVLFFVGNRTTVAKESIIKFLAQDYPSDKYDLIAITYSENNFLAELPVRQLIVPEQYNKSLSVKFAIENLPEKSSDVLIVMDADSVIYESDFLVKINNACNSGCKALQTHRRAKNLDSDTALFGAASEEINNGIFRKGHVNLGFSSGLMGSGMALNFDWIKKNVSRITNVDLVKQLEIMLLEDFVFIDYLSDVSFCVEKADKAEDFYKQRNAWITNQTANINIMIRKLPSALLRGNYDYCEKLLQWLIPSRIILIGTLIMISIFLLVVAWGMAIKWIIILFLLIIAFSISLPDYLIDARFVKALRSAPLLFVITLLNVLKKKFVK